MLRFRTAAFASAPISRYCASRALCRRDIDPGDRMSVSPSGRATPRDAARAAASNPRAWIAICTSSSGVAAEIAGNVASIASNARSRSASWCSAADRLRRDAVSAAGRRRSSWSAISEPVVPHRLTCDLRIRSTSLAGSSNLLGSPRKDPASRSYDRRPTDRAQDTSRIRIPFVTKANRGPRRPPILSRSQHCWRGPVVLAVRRECGRLGCSARQFLAVVGGLLELFPFEPLLPPHPPPAVFGGLLPLFPLLQSSDNFAFTPGTGPVGVVLVQPTANSDATVREARMRLIIRSPLPRVYHALQRVVVLAAARTASPSPYGPVLTKESRHVRLAAGYIAIARHLTSRRAPGCRLVAGHANCLTPPG